MNLSRLKMLTAVMVVAANVSFATTPRVAATANNQFGIELFKKTTKVSAKGNKFISPTSAYLALSMLLNGAAGDTQSAIAKTLTVSGLTRDDMNSANLAFMDSLTSRNSEFKMEIANGLWSQRGSQLLPDFQTRVEDFYRGTSEEVDFASPEALLSINQWASDKTHGKIPKILEQVPPLTRVVLANAMYFDAKWTQRFPDYGSRNEAFTLKNGKKVEVPMMGMDATLQYARLANAEVASLPYGKRGTARMIVVKPTQGIESFEKGLTAKTWNDLVTGLNASKAAYGEIRMPSIELSYDSELNDQLKAMGMGVAFDDSKANFSEMLKEAISVSSVIQKTYLKVNEEGTIAAAVTAITGVAASIPPQPQFSLVLDRPYLVAIEDAKSGAILFMASIAQPEGGALPKKP